MLANYQPLDQRERGFRVQMQALLQSGSGAFHRDHYEPGHFTASAFVLSPDSDELLLIDHAKLKRWLQPGGHVEPEDQDLVATACRETHEETGLDDMVQLGDGIFDLDIHLIPASAMPAHRHFDVRFLFQARSRVASAASDAQAVRWVPVDEMGGIRSDSSVARVLSRLRCRPSISSQGAHK